MPLHPNLKSVAPSQRGLQNTRPSILTPGQRVSSRLQLLDRLIVSGVWRPAFRLGGKGPLLSSTGKMIIEGVISVALLSLISYILLAQ